MSFDYYSIVVQGTIALYYWPLHLYSLTHFSLKFLATQRDEWEIL